jgi:hypothetical protein
MIPDIDLSRNQIDIDYNGQGVYLIKNKRSGIAYVGSSLHVKGRIRDHWRAYLRGKHPNEFITYLFDTAERFGDISVCVLYKTTTVQETKDMEDWMIMTLMPKANKDVRSSYTGSQKRPKGYKITSVPHPEWRRKQKSISQGGDNHWTKKKQVPFSIESRMKMRESQLSLYRNGYVSPRKGQKMSKEDMDNRRLFTRPVIRMSVDGEEIDGWLSVKWAAEAVGVSSSNVIKCCQGKSKTSGGYIWKYAKRARNIPS